eukprot:scaffold1890_cov128-Chaetoceros_neogracile.AAC.2
MAEERKKAIDGEGGIYFDGRKKKDQMDPCDDGNMDDGRIMKEAINNDVLYNAFFPKNDHFYINYIDAPTNDFLTIYTSSSVKAVDCSAAAAEEDTGTQIKAVESPAFIAIGNLVEERSFYAVKQNYARSTVENKEQRLEVYAQNLRLRFQDDKRVHRFTLCPDATTVLLSGVARSFLKYRSQQTNCTDHFEIGGPTFENTQDWI